jgi:hypothetical protein
MVAIPITAEIHIQNTAPGPPITIAVATPAIFPFPTIPDNADMSAWNGVMFPSPDERAELKNNFVADENRENCIHFNLIEKYIPLPSMKRSIWGPQIKSAISLINSNTNI